MAQTLEATFEWLGLGARPQRLMAVIEQLIESTQD